MKCGVCCWVQLDCKNRFLLTCFIHLYLSVWARFTVRLATNMRWTRVAICTVLSFISFRIFVVPLFYFCSQKNIQHSRCNRVKTMRQPYKCADWVEHNRSAYTVCITHTAFVYERGKHLPMRRHCNRIKINETIRRSIFQSKLMNIWSGNDKERICDHVCALALCIAMKNTLRILLRLKLKLKERRNRDVMLWMFGMKVFFKCKTD